MNVKLFLEKNDIVRTIQEDRQTYINNIKKNVADYISTT